MSCFWNPLVCAPCLCFPGTARVRVLLPQDSDAEDQSMKTMLKRIDSLHDSDLVGVGDGSFSQVAFWSHRNVGTKATFLRIRTNGGRELTMSACHYLYVYRSSPFAEAELVDAEHVQPGDVVYAGVNADELDTVMDVKLVEDFGLYCPHTFSGKVVVEDLLCSCYTSAWGKLLMHAAFWPIMYAQHLVGVRSMVNTSTYSTVRS